MRELEFLPDWYPQALRRQSILRLHFATALAVLAAMATWCWQAHRNIAIAQASADTVNMQLGQSKLELRQLDEQLELQRQLELQHRIVVRLGLPVEMSRVVQTLDALMPKEMSLVEISADRRDEDLRAKNGKVSGPGAPNEASIDRHLEVKLVAVTPSDVDLANFLAGLTNTAFFEHVAMTYSRDKSQNGHLMREFEVTFTLNLNESGSGPRDAGADRSGVASTEAGDE